MKLASANGEVQSCKCKGKIGTHHSPTNKCGALFGSILNHDVSLPTKIANGRTILFDGPLSSWRNSRTEAFRRRSRWFAHGLRMVRSPPTARPRIPSTGAAKRTCRYSRCQDPSHWTQTRSFLSEMIRVQPFLEREVHRMTWTNKRHDTWMQDES